MPKTESQMNFLNQAAVPQTHEKLSWASIAIYHGVFTVWKYKEYGCRTRHTGLFWAV